LRTELSQLEIDQFRAAGFVVIPHLLDDDELCAWRAMAEAEVAANARTAHYSIRSSGMAKRDSAWSAITRDPRLGKMAATLAGVSSVRHATDHISYSEPNCPPTPWHCVIHEGFFSDTREAVGIQVQLDANTVQNKAMLFLPGSHLSAPFGRRHDTSPALDPTRTFGSIFDDVPEWREIDPVAAECDAGSALFWNLALVHGSGSNMTRQVRRYVGTSFIPADATWNGEAGSVSREAAFELEAGQVLDTPDTPVVWPVLT
jgi:ectoine hydroxylase-related dioxygenase (phytanoyl-CoA dioxygenase family)